MFELFKRLFPNRKERDFKVDEKTLSKRRNFVRKEIKLPTSTKFTFASCQSSGKTRFHNEDTVFTTLTELYGVDAPVTFGIFLVADGMGGHQSGEVASRLAAQAVSKELIEGLFEPVIYGGRVASEDKLLHLVKEAVSEAQRQIHHQVPGGGTTLTLAMVIGDSFYSAHVGDSRLYVVDKAGQMTLKTKDHSLVKRLVDLGEITSQEASSHPQRNVLYRALGQEDALEADIDLFSLEISERMMICSDGLWGVVQTDEMERIINSRQPLAKITCELVNAANEAGGPDNISVILVERLA